MYMTYTHTCTFRIKLIRLSCYFDTIMIVPNAQQQRILSLILQRGSMRSSQVHESLLKMQEQLSLVTVKRVLAGMANRRSHQS